MKKEIILLAAVSALTLLPACNKNTDTQESTGADVITFSPVLDGGVDETRGTLKTGTTYGTEDFWASAWTGTTNVFPYMEVKQFTYTTGSQHTYWSTVDNSDNKKEFFWKKNGSTIETKTFFAYTNLPTASGAATMANTSSASQTLTYDVTKVQTASDQTDILLGYYSGTGKEITHSTNYKERAAEINFRHPLTAVKFKKGDIDGWNTGDKITKIEIAGVYASGVCTDNGSFTWAPGSTTTTVSMSNTSGLAIDSTSSLIGEPFLLIPQNLAANSYTLTVELTVDGTSYTASATLSTENLEAGKYYTYTLDYSPGKMTGLVVSVSAWGVVYSDDAKTVDYFTAKFD